MWIFVFGHFEVTRNTRALMTLKYGFDDREHCNYTAAFGGDFSRRS
jgi:hypothetical protein